MTLTTCCCHTWQLQEYVVVTHDHYKNMLSSMTTTRIYYCHLYPLQEHVIVTHGYYKNMLLSRKATTRACNNEKSPYMKVFDSDKKSTTLLTTNGRMHIIVNQQGFEDSNYPDILENLIQTHTVLIKIIDYIQDTETYSKFKQLVVTMSTDLIVASTFYKNGVASFT